MALPNNRRIFDMTRNTWKICRVEDYAQSLGMEGREP